MNSRRICPGCGRRCREFNLNMECRSKRRKELRELVRIRSLMRANG